MTATAAPPRGAAPQGTLRARLAWIGALSFASGFPYFFFNETVPIWLAASDVSLAEIGFAGAASLPWALKVFWAPLVDRLGSRRAWIRACLLLLAVGSAAFVVADPMRHAGWLGLLLLAYVALSATQDIAIDAYTIETTRGDELGVANSVRIGAYRSASFVASAFLVWVAARGGWDGAFVAAAVLFALLAAGSVLLPAVSHAPSATLSPPPSASAAAGSAASLAEPLLAFVRRPEWWAVALFALLFKLDISAMEPMTKPFWLAKGFTLDEVAALTTGRLVATLAGATLGGVLATKLGLFRALWMMGLVQLLSSLGYAGAAAVPADKWLVTAVALFENFAAGLGTAAFLAFLMSVCERRYAATQFALLTALFALSRTGAVAVSGVLTEQMGYASYFLLTFFMGLPAYLLLPRLRSVRAPEDSAAG